MRKSPEKVHRLVQFTTDCLIDIYKEFIQEGVLILQCDPLASGTILRKSQYQEFVLPYAKKVNQAIHDAVNNNADFLDKNSCVTFDFVDYIFLNLKTKII